MDELQAIRNFRGDVPAWDEDARDAARGALLSHIAAAANSRSRLWTRQRGHTSSRARPHRWPRLAVVAALLLLAGLTAASALALYEFIAGEPAPAPIAQELAGEGTAERIIPFFVGDPNVIAESAHGVAAVETSAGRAILWLVNAEPGPVCYFVEFETLTRRTGQPTGATCGTRLSSAVPIAYDVNRATVGRREVVIVVGWVHDNVASVLLQAPDGTERELALTERFYIAEIQADRVGEGNRPTLIAKDAAGATLQRVELDSRTSSLPVFPKTVGAKRTVIETTDSRGRPMSLSLVPIEGGATCLEFKTANGTSISCGRQPRTAEGSNVHPTLMGSLVYLSGSVGPEVAKLELQHEDGSVLELPIVERFVFYDVPRERFAEGRRPTLLVARGADGAEVDRWKVNRKRYFGIRREDDVRP